MEKDAFSELIKTYKRDQATYPDTINLGVGVYLSEDGTLQQMASVQIAERHVVEQDSKTYPPMSGDPIFCEALKSFLFRDRAQHKRISVIQTVAGSGALHVIAAVLAEASPPLATFWLPQPTWSNFWPLTKSTMRQATYSCLSPDQSAFSFDTFARSLEAAKAGDAVLLQLIGNNPTGIDPDHTTLTDIAVLLKERGLFPVVDAAYIGFGEGPEEDAWQVSTFLQQFDEAALAFSGSKSFSLYSDRVGAAVFVTQMRLHAERVETAAIARIRQIYSMPPTHGARIVAKILKDTEARQAWCYEMKRYCNRLQGLRTGLAEVLTGLGSEVLSRRLLNGTGMFFLTGLDSEAVLQLRNEAQVYLAPDGRLNLSGLTPGNIQRVAQILHRTTVR